MPLALLPGGGAAGAHATADGSRRIASSKRGVIRLLTSIIRELWMTVDRYTSLGESV